MSLRQECPKTTAHLHFPTFGPALVLVRTLGRGAATVSGRDFLAPGRYGHGNSLCWMEGDISVQSGLTGGDRSSRPLLTVGMPAYNEASQIASSVRAVRDALDTVGVPWELVVVDDGSSDGTEGELRATVAGDDRIRVIRLPQNRGVGFAIATAIGSAGGEWFMVIPADLAMDLRDIRRYLSAVTPGVAAVAGYTATRGDYSPWRALVSIVNRWAVCMLVGIYVRNPNYIHMYRREAVSQAHLTCTGSPALFAELLSICARFGEIVEIPVRYVPRTTGRATGARWQSILATGRGLVRLALSRHVSEHVRPKPN
ncbi:MAG: glycosyltransferase family 2 protein [Proteobacteria bacterium]|nr:glycosyltransferase family 2 protein [Pseudomonadota bacterium]